MSYTIQYLVDQLDRAFKANQLPDAHHILELLREKVGTPGGAPPEPNIRATPGTIVECALCHDIEAPEYRLRRVMGRYALLCFKNGNGCWERSPRPNCGFKDEQGVQCGFPAEVIVSYGVDKTTTRNVCAMHVGTCLTPAHGTMHVDPLEI